jgi:uncharacterized protein YggE
MLRLKPTSGEEMKSLTMLLIGTLFLTTVAHAQESAVLSVSGEGSVSVAPDMAEVSVGVSTRDAAADAALQATSEAVAIVIATVRDAGISDSDIQTSGVSLFPLRPAPGREGDGLQSIEGFEASNTLRITVRDLDLLGPVLDAVVRDGANELNGLRFALQNPDSAMAEARTAAVRDAMTRAEQLSEAAGVSLGAILSLSEGGGRGVPMMDMAPMQRAEVPIAPGALTVSAFVSMTFAIE